MLFSNKENEIPHEQDHSAKNNKELSDSDVQMTTMA